MGTAPTIPVPVLIVYLDTMALQSGFDACAAHGTALGWDDAGTRPRPIGRGVVPERLP